MSATSVIEARAAELAKAVRTVSKPGDVITMRVGPIPKDVQDRVNAAYRAARAEAAGRSDTSADKTAPDAK